MHIRRRALALITCLALLLTAAVASGCGSGSSSEGSDDTLRLLAQSRPLSFDPAFVAPEGAAFYLDPIYETLVNQGPNGSFSPGLALEWEYPDPRTFEMTLRKGVTFSDGTPFDAEAAKANIDRIVAGDSFAGTWLKSIKSTEVLADDKVRLHLDPPNPALPAIFAQPVGAMVSPKALADPRKLASDPVGTGPYVLDKGGNKTIPNERYTYVKRSGSHWTGDLYPWKTIVTRTMIDANARLNALRSGQADVGMGDPRLAKAAKGAGLQVIPNQSVVYLVQLMDREGDVVKALADPRVRRALNLAIDRKAFVDAVLQGYGTPTSQLIKPEQPGFEEELENAYPYDPEEAKRLLAEAGYADGFSMGLLTDSTTKTELETLGGYWSEIGVDLEVAVHDEDIVPQIHSGDWPGFMDTTTSPTPIVMYKTTLFEGVGDVFLNNGTPQMREAYSKAQASTDVEDQQRYFSELSRLVIEDSWEIPLARGGTPIFATDGFTVKAWPSQPEPHLRGIKPAG